jgi:small-conductance mechanosensitive channel
MESSIISSIVRGILGDILPRILPNRDEQLKAQTELEKIDLTQAFEEKKLQYDAMTSQIDVNKAEAANPNIFVSGARPAAMWICNIALLFGVFVKILLPAIIIILPIFGYTNNPAVQQSVKDLASIDIEMYIAIGSSLLGLAALRSYDKKNGVARC